MRKDIFLTQSELENYKEYDLTGFLPPDTASVPPIYIGDLEDNFEDILPSHVLSELEKNRSQEGEEKLRKYLETRLDFNSNGLFLYALAKSMQNDSTFMEDVRNMNVKGIEPSTSLMSSNYLENFTAQELELWYNQIPIMINFYYSDLLHRYIVLEE